MEANLSAGKSASGRRQGHRRDPSRNDTCRRAEEDRRDYGIGRSLIGIMVTIKLYRAVEVLKFLKAIKVLEPLAVVASGILTAGAYSFTMKASLAFGLILALTVHELGHYWATKYLGLKAKWWIFIPFVGALMPAPKFRSRTDEALIAFCGPYVGGIFSYLLFLLWIILPLSREWSIILYTVSLLSTALNLFNMIPLSPIDGGRITQAVHPMFRWIGFSLLLGVSLYFAQASMLLVWMLVVGDIRMSALRRFQVTFGLWLAMPIFILLGFHGEYQIEEWFYFVVATWLLKVYYDWYKCPPPVARCFRSETLSKLERRRWGVRYMGLLVFLLGLLSLHFSYASRFSL